MLDKFYTNEFDEAIALIKDNREYCIKDIKSLVANKVPKIKALDTQYVAIIDDNHFNFVINFFACIFAEKEIIVIDDKRRLEHIEAEHVLMDDDFSACNKKVKFDFIDSNKSFINFFTSGSSGKPKLIRKTLQNVVSEAEDIIREFNLSQYKDLMVLSTTKLNHTYGIAYHFIMPFIAGFIINADNIDYPEQVDYKNSCLISSPSFLEKLIKYDINLEEKPLTIFSAGAKLDNTTFKSLEKFTKVVDIYGTTETATIAYRTGSDLQSYIVLEKVKINKDSQNQLIVRSDYFIEDEFVVCDFVNIKSPSAFELFERSDRIMKIQELRISASELENKLNQNEFVEASYCFKYGGKVACAVALNKNGRNYFIKNGNINTIKYLKSSLSEFFKIVPQRWRFLHEIPTTQTGKIDTEMIREIFDTNLSYPLVLEEAADSHNVKIKLLFPENSNFFEGHFTNHPIVPGVVQLYFANWFIKYYFKIDMPVNEIKKIKFSHIIKPKQEIILELSNKNDNISFKYFDNETTYSSGLFTNKQILVV